MKHIAVYLLPVLFCFASTKAGVYSEDRGLDDTLPMEKFNNMFNLARLAHNVSDDNQQNNNNASSTALNLPRGYVVISKSKEYATAIKLHKTKQTWNEARKRCFREGGFLAYATSKQEEKKFLKLMKANKVIDIWVGIHDLFEVGDFATILGEIASKVAYYDWRPGQPDDSNANERCTHFRLGGLNDLPCDVPNSYICKIKRPLPL